MVYMLRFSMMISSRFGKFWTIIEVPPFRRYIFMPTAIRISGKSTITSILHSNEYSHHGNVRAGYVVRLAGSAQSLHHPVIMCALTWIRLNYQYHRICYWNLGQHQRFDLPASTIVNIGAVFRCSGRPLENSDEIAFFPSAEAPYLGSWATFRGGGAREIMPNGWTRFQSRDVINSTLHLSCSMLSDRNTWLSQANHIFHRLQIVSNFADYVVVDFIRFDLDILQTTGKSPEGFLFLCPEEDFRTGPSSFCCPTCHAYWSLDPSGTNRLSLEEATQLGFPALKISAEALGFHWDDRVYNGLRQFHQSKGFDPYSEDVARHLGLPLSQLSSERDAHWAYVDSDDEDFDADINSGCNSAYVDDYDSEYLSTSAYDDSDQGTNAESSRSEADVHHPAGGNCESEHAELSDYCNHDASESSVEDDRVVEEMFAPSRLLNVLTSIHLVLILFLGLSWVYDHVVVSFV
ncbi:hypothetical protein MSAN_00942700 [Mycena sanguinolenta]|uniref:Uncharacterized protein n=1 Tax=Mycena sanguinolenta TaxID=230812 RepID=A0A8H6YX49_9AGAR|nr:hypothetical protein MSAN_00942700 [Mycena sanguinolenta]